MDEEVNVIEDLIDAILDKQDIKSVEIRRHEHHDDEKGITFEYMAIARIDRGGFSKSYGSKLEPTLKSLREKC